MLSFIKKIITPQSKYYAPQLNEVILYFSFFHFSFNLYKSTQNFHAILLSHFFETPKRYIIINEKEIKQSVNLNENYLDYCIKNSNKYHGYYPHCPYLYKKNEKNIQKQIDEKLKFCWCQSTQFEWLEKIASVCKEMNFKLYFVLPPYAKTLLSDLTHEFNTVITQQLKQVFHTKLLDFTYDTSFMTDDFF